MPLSFSAQPPSQTDTDALIDTVTEQITLHSFDPNNQQILQQLVEGMGDTRGTIRLRIAQTLADIGEPATPVLICALADHPNPVVRRAAAKTLTLIADPISIPTLVHALLHDDDTVVQGSAVGALARVGKPAVPVLLDILKTSEHSESIRGHAAWALSFIGPEAKDLLYAEIHAHSPHVRAAVVAAISKIAQESPSDLEFQLLTQALNDDDTDVRAEAAAAIGILAYLPAAHQLLALLAHPDPNTRKAAALALMKLAIAQNQSAIDSPHILNALNVAANQEVEQTVQNVLKLAISQINSQSNNTDDWS